MAHKSSNARARRGSDSLATASPALLPRHFTLPLRWAIALLFLIVLRYAWMSDDAFITLRTVDNFWHGWGLRWNILERVQSYTHPLWMMLLAAGYGVTREPYYTTLAISVLCLAGVVALLVRRLDPARALVAVTAIIASRAMVDYSTSGLENPLSHLLLAAFCLILIDEKAAAPAGDEASAERRQVARYRTLAWLTAGCILTRMELILLVGPAMLVETWRLGARRALPVAVPAALVVACWHLFTLVYYGSLLPNTALAKLSPGVPRSRFLEQGLWYLRDSLRYDFVTLPLIVAGIAAAAWRNARAWPMAIGLGAMIGFIIWVGGDFMSGRFLTPAAMCAIILLASRVRKPLAAGGVAVALLFMAAVTPRPTLMFWQPDRIYDWIREVYRSTEHGIVDERRVYQMEAGLVHVLFEGAAPGKHGWAKMGTQGQFMPSVRVHGAVGLLGFYGGPGTHVIDDMALGEPFLARLPPNMRVFRPGHYQRVVPPDYLESVTACFNYVFPNGSMEAGGRSCLDVPDKVNLMKNPTLHQMLSDVMIITQGPLFDSRRWQAIWRLRPLSQMPSGS